MKINNKTAIALISILLIISINYVDTVRSAGIGVAPAQIIMEDKLKGTSYIKSIRLFNNGDEPITFELNVTGDIIPWVTIYKTSELIESIHNISVYGKEEIIIQFTIPPETANGVYSGTINAKTVSKIINPDMTGGIVNLVFPVNISIGITGMQILTGEVTNINTNDIEVGQPLDIELGFLNKGNVIATPKVIVTIFDEDDLEIDSITYSDTDVDIESDELINVEWDNTNQTTGKYTANVKVYLGDNMIKDQNLTFNILPTGSLIPTGEITNLSYSGKLAKGETIIINAEYKNTGRIKTNAKFVAKVYKNDELIETLQNPENPDNIPTVKINDTYNFTVYYKFKDTGYYEIKSYIELNGDNKTATKILTFDLGGSFGNITILGIIIILLVIIGLYVYFSKKEKTKPKKKKINKQTLKKSKRIAKEIKKIKPKNPNKKSFSKKLGKLKNKRIRFRFKPSSKK